MLRARVDRHRCVGAGTRITIAPTAFDWYRGDFAKASVADATSVEDEVLHEAALACPTGAIVVEEIEELLPWQLRGKEAPRRVEKTFMFTDIERSTNLVEALGDEAWQGLLRWHDETLRSLFRLDLDRLAHEAVRRLAEQDLARRGVLLQAGGDVDGVAGHDRGIDGRHTGHDLAGVHADAHLDRHAPVPLELLVQGREPLAHVRRGPRRPERVVLVQLRDAEDRHHRIAGVLLDGAAVPFDRGSHRLEVPSLDVAERLRVQSFAERGRTGDVAEDHGDGLADLPGRRRGRQRSSAGRAELELVRALAPAVRAGNHGREPTVGDRPMLADPCCSGWVDSQLQPGRLRTQDRGHELNVTGARDRARCLIGALGVARRAPRRPPGRA